MKLTPLHNNYINPLTGTTVENAFINDGFLKDDAIEGRLEISFRLQKTVTVKEIDFLSEAPKEIEVEKNIPIAETVLVFDTYERPTMVTIKNNQVDLFKYLTDGSKLNGSEDIIVGYPNYKTVQKYFLKDNIGDPLVINPELPELYQKLVSLFILNGMDRNGKPIGFYGENFGSQFKFEK